MLNNNLAGTNVPLVRTVHMSKRHTKPDGVLTLEQIATLTRTSKSTVSRVISHDPRISEKTRARVMKVVDKMNYRPNVFARALAGGKTGLIGVISSNIGSGFYAEVIRSMDVVFGQLGKRLLVSFAHHEEDYATLWQDIVLGGRVEGLIVVAPTAEFFNLPLSPDNVPVVLCTGNPPAKNKEWQNVDRVGMNNGKAMMDLVSHLASHGHRRILHAAGWSNNFDAVERQHSFMEACRTLKVDGETKTFGMIPSDGRDAMKTFLNRKNTLPDAIIAFNDSIAMGILEAWQTNGGSNQPPFALTGWDDSPSSSVIGLTSVNIPYFQLGEESARLLHQRIEGISMQPMQHRLIDLSIVQRSSTLRVHHG